MAIWPATAGWGNIRAERLPWRCRRFLLPDFVVFMGGPVIHVIEAGKLPEYRLNPIARREGERLV